MGGSRKKMKAKDLIKKLSYNLEAEIFFEEDVYNHKGEHEKFPLGFKNIYGNDKEVIIVLEEN